MSNRQSSSVVEPQHRPPTRGRHPEDRGSGPAASGTGSQRRAPDSDRDRSSPLQMDENVLASLLDRHRDEHNAGHLYDRVAEHLQHRGYRGLAQHFRIAAAEERGPHAQRVEDILHAFDIDPPHPIVHEPSLDSNPSVLDLLYLAWRTEAELLRAYEQTKALAADREELAVESLVDAVLEDQLHEVAEARTLFRRCESAVGDGTGIMAIDGLIAAEAAEG